jgi:hypothetical protein
LVEAYLALGIVKEAQTAAAVLGHNYPGTDWYEDSFALMQEYGKEPRGRPLAQVKVPDEAMPVAQPLPANPTPVPPPPDDDEPHKPAPEAQPEKTSDEDGGWFDWF